MRILLGSDTYLPDCNGAAYFTQRLALGLKARGHDLRVVAASLSRRSGAEELHGIDITRIASIPVPRYPALRFSPRPPFGPDRLLERTIREFDPDIIHVQNHFFLSRALIRAGNRLHVPVVATNHFVPENIGVQLAFFPEPIRRGAIAWMGRDLVKSYAGAVSVAAPTPIAAGLLEATGTLHKVTPISCGIDLSLYPEEGPGEPATRARFGIPERPTVMFVGRLDLEKNLDELIRAFTLVRREQPEAQLVLVGKGMEQPHLEELARTEGIADRVVFTGFLPDEDLPHIYRAGDVFCMPGTAELQSIVTLEAMASKRPVVAADALALPHLAHHGENGFTYTPGNIEELARRLVEVLGDAERRRQMGERSREIVAAHDVERTLDSYEAFYRAALEPRAAESGRALAAA